MNGDEKTALVGFALAVILMAIIWYIMVQPITVPVTHFCALGDAACKQAASAP